jgi:transglutaminase-like putative cysteine protease
MKDPLLEFFDQNIYLIPPGDEHLQASALCDFHEDSIDQLQKKLFANLKDPAKITDKAYDFIRQKILYAFDAWEVSADETYAKGTGMCFNKTNLMIALLRSARIPSVFSAFWIRKEGFLFTTDPEMFEKITPVTVHIFCEVYLGKKIGWRRFVDTSLDTRLRQVLERQGYRPHQNVLLDRPIERFFTPEEVIAWRKKYKEAMGVKEVITFEEMEASNRKLRELRNQSARH